MNAKKLRIISVIVGSIIFLALYVCIWKRINTVTVLHFVVTEEGLEEVRLVEQHLPFGVAPSMQNEEYNVLDIGWWQEEEGAADNYLFLPDFIDLSDVHAWISYEGNAGEAVCFDEITLQENAVCRLGEVDEGSHVISIGKDMVEIQIMKGSRLSSVWIDTEKSMDYIHKDQKNVTPGTIRVLSADGNIQYTGEVESLKGRGNSSWSMQKKSYGLKLVAPASLLGMTSGRSWILSGDGGDITGLRNKLLYDMAVYCGLKNAVESEWIDLYINGNYYGCYLLTEKITIGNGRLEIGDLEQETESLNEEPIEAYPYYVFEENGREWSGYSVPNQPGDMAGGYLLEMEEYQARFRGELSRFTTGYNHSVVVKEPTHATLEQVEYISSFVQNFEDAIYAEDGYSSEGKYYLEYIDLESFVKRYLIDEISKNVDAGYSSYFFYKPKEESILYAGPVWDYDASLGNNQDWGDTGTMQNPEGMYANNANWTKELWEKTEFREGTKKVFQESFLPYLESVLETGLDEYTRAIQDSADMEQILYGRENREGEIRKLREFLQKRTEFLKEELQ